MSQTNVSNIESGKLTPFLVDVELILEALGAEQGTAAARCSGSAPSTR